MDLKKDSVDLLFLENGVVALDACVLSDLVKYRNKKSKEIELKKNNKWNEDFMKNQETLYNALKKNNTIIIPLLTQMEIATDSVSFLDMMQLIKDLRCEFVPYPSDLLMQNIEKWTNQKPTKELSSCLDKNKLQIVLNNMDEENYKNLITKSRKIFTDDLIKKYRIKRDKADKNLFFNQ